MNCLPIQNDEFGQRQYTLNGKSYNGILRFTDVFKPIINHLKKVIRELK